MSAERRAGPTGSRMLSWLLGSALVGWVVVYNAMRLAGSSPADAAWISLAVGAAAGVGVFLLLVLAGRRLAASGRVVHRGPLEVPAPGALDPAQRDAARLASLGLGALAIVALAAGAYLAADWALSEPGGRATTTLILAAWNLLAGLWLGDEAVRLRRLEADGIDSAVLGCILTAVLAGVGLSRDTIPSVQVALIVLSGVAGALAGLLVWRLQGARGVPGGAIAAAVVATLALILPLVL